MASLKINNKTYVVPEFTFRHSKIMEQMGLPVDGMLNKNYFYTAISVFVSIVVGCDSETADDLIEQHVLGGGDIKVLYQAYVEAMSESNFFKKMTAQMIEGQKNPSQQKTEQK